MTAKIDENTQIIEDEIHERYVYSKKFWLKQAEEFVLSMDDGKITKRKVKLKLISNEEK